jgi:transposase
MKQCSECGHDRHYLLNDGRLKCRSCGHRFSWTSVWDSVRLPVSTKHHLLQLFVLGVPSYRQRFSSSTSDVSRERFYRLLRACCAKIEQLTEPFNAIASDERGASNAGTPEHRERRSVIVVGLVNHQGRISVHPVPTGAGRTLLDGTHSQLRENTVPEGDASQAYAMLKLRGEHVTIGSDKRARAGRGRIDGIDGFWSHARNWMHPYRTVPRRYFHLYLAEACYRYNHRQQDLGPLLLALMKTLSIQELRPILDRKA